ncbi:MAG TPA: FMN-binding negative transcriptional regulator [Ramlibacter sp.]|jgi:transcriptional regulator|uniref:FMN-binding negative transcriptional regulator n=1 Tax=Ramlibacter sp. TaxID=1917967 RepID=UPI002D4B8824|nr:FMN-binding negative transcriptional regulator [Ramlibacter sp.]HZY18618.1 FMN-binding negative transcriptional regulator [Ramlibacter sp.]
MYMPPQFRARDESIAVDLMRAHPLASLVTCDDEGFPFVTHLPLHVEQGEGGLVLWGHVARPNPQWRHLQARPRALATFLGPHGYLSPKVYPDLQRVPSWNYLAVHCEVEARLVEDPDAKDALLKKLIGDHEPAYAAQWRSLDADFAHKLLQGIVGFELRITDVQSKVKLNQHRPESHRALHAAYRDGGENERALAGWMVRLGLAEE